MRVRVLVAVAALVAAGGVVGCDRTTPGIVAMTTQSGAPTVSSSPRTTTTRPTAPRTSTPRSSSGAAPPSDVMTLTCEQYVELDPATQTAVIQEILTQAGSGSALDPEQPEVAKLIVDATCTFLPKAVISDFLAGQPPR